MCYGAVVSGVLNMVGSGIQAYGQYSQAKAEKKAAFRQAELETMRAAEARSQAADAALEQGERRRQLVATGLAGAAANGVALNASPLDTSSIWEQDQEAVGAYETSKIEHDADVQAWGFLSNADMLRYQGKMATYAGRYKAWGSLLSGAGSAAGSASSAYSSYTSGGSAYSS